MDLGLDREGGALLNEITVPLRRAPWRRKWQLTPVFLLG